MSWPSAKRARIYARDCNRCVECGSADELTLDHKIPRSRGGTNAEENLQTLCRPCNQSKSNRLPDEGFLPGSLKTSRRPHRQLRHTPACLPGSCFCECPVLLEKHPQLARALRANPSPYR